MSAHPTPPPTDPAAHVPSVGTTIPHDSAVGHVTGAAAYIADLPRRADELVVGFVPSPQAAGRIGVGIYDRVQILQENPEAGSILDELRAGGWRKLIFRRWKIIYTIRDETIIIGRVWPAAMGEADLKTPL